jgi:hypothetical protein
MDLPLQEVDNLDRETRLKEALYILYINCLSVKRM